MKVALIVLCLVVVAVNANHFVCNPNKAYEENKCNRCTCFIDSRGILRFRCTPKTCTGKKYEFFRKCDPAVPIPCNNCWCIPPYGIICQLP
ncbi:hypothetical protein RN001_015509 [Aquatica leii]|uniref:Protease inhibitor n=1 Tax=Aquatica leii TaxID=1421715 RepID=A0AAN7SNI9_9COLE|nr:hypothetical protein RN001_015509 [Aquatica leii]